MHMDNATLAKYMDSTLLKPEATPSDVAALVADAVQHDVYSVCVSPNMLPVEIPAGSDVKVAVVTGFPSGKHDSRVKALEAQIAVTNGAHEIDMVIDVAAAAEHRFEDVEADVREVRGVAPRPTVLKVILETAALDDEAIVGASKAAARAGADFVKTSTGFHPSGGASVHAVRLMSEAVEGKLGVKASGGIRSRAAALEMIEAGATRLGVSAAAAILADDTDASGSGY